MSLLVSSSFRDCFTFVSINGGAKHLICSLTCMLSKNEKVWNLLVITNRLLVRCLCLLVCLGKQTPEKNGPLQSPEWLYLDVGRLKRSAFIVFQPQCLCHQSSLQNWFALPILFCCAFYCDYLCTATVWIDRSSFYLLSTQNINKIKESDVQQNPTQFTIPSKSGAFSFYHVGQVNLSTG